MKSTTITLPFRASAASRGMAAITVCISNEA